MDINLLHSQLLTGKNAVRNTDGNAGPSAVNKDDLKEVAKEMESIFAYQLLKVMRETSKSFSAENKGLGNDTYMSMFDMEISKLFAERGMGLQDILVNQLGRMTETNKE